MNGAIGGMDSSYYAFCGVSANVTYWIHDIDDRRTILRLTPTLSFSSSMSMTSRKLPLTGLVTPLTPQ